jgi:hypothetical protein
MWKLIKSPNQNESQPQLGQTFLENGIFAEFRPEIGTQKSWVLGMGMGATQTPNTHTR